MKYIIAVIAIIIIAGGAFFIFGGKDNNSSQNTSPAVQNSTNTSTNNNQNSAANNKISISGFAFSPADTTVKKGTTVTWTNNDSVAHTVTVDSGDGPNSGSLSSGQTYRFTFNSTGTFNYHCSFHAQMHGTIKVTD